MPVVGLFRPNGFVEKAGKGGAEISDDDLVKSGKGLVVFGEVVFFVEVEPLEKETLHFPLGPRVFEHALDVFLEDVVVSKPAFGCGLFERSIGNGIPKLQREIKGSRVKIRLAFGIEI